MTCALPGLIHMFLAHMLWLVVSRLPTLAGFDCPPETCAGKFLK